MLDVFGVWRSESEDAGFEVLLVEPGVREMPKDPNVPTIIGELLADDWYNVVCNATDQGTVPQINFSFRWQQYIVYRPRKIWIKARQHKRVGSTSV